MEALQSECMLFYVKHQFPIRPVFVCNLQFPYTNHNTHTHAHTNLISAFGWKRLRSAYSVVSIQRFSCEVFVDCIGCVHCASYLRCLQVAICLIFLLHNNSSTFLCPPVVTINGQWNKNQKQQRLLWFCNKSNEQLIWSQRFLVFWLFAEEKKKYCLCVNLLLPTNIFTSFFCCSA